MDLEALLQDEEELEAQREAQAEAERAAQQAQQPSHRFGHGHGYGHGHGVRLTAQGHAVPRPAMRAPTYAHQLQDAYDDLLKRHATAEGTIETLKLVQGNGTGFDDSDVEDDAINRSQYEYDLEQARAATRRAQLEATRARENMLHMENELNACRRELQAQAQTHEANHQARGELENQLAATEDRLERCIQENDLLVQDYNALADSYNQLREEMASHEQDDSARTQRMQEEIDYWRSQCHQQEDSRVHLATKPTTIGQDLQLTPQDRQLPPHRPTSAAQRARDELSGSIAAESDPRNLPTTATGAIDLMALRFDLGQLLQQLHEVVSEAFLARQSLDRLTSLSNSPHAQDRVSLDQDIVEVQDQIRELRQRYDHFCKQHQQHVLRFPDLTAVPSEWLRPPTFPALPIDPRSSARQAGHAAMATQRATQAERREALRPVLETPTSESPPTPPVDDTATAATQPATSISASHTVSRREATTLSRASADEQSQQAHKPSARSLRPVSLSELEATSPTASEVEVEPLRQSAISDDAMQSPLRHSILKTSREQRGSLVADLERSVRFASDDTVYDISPAGQPGVLSRFFSNGDRQPRFVPSKGVSPSSALSTAVGRLPNLASAAVGASPSLAGTRARTAVPTSATAETNDSASPPATTSVNQKDPELGPSSVASSLSSSFTRSFTNYPDGQSMDSVTATPRAQLADLDRYNALAEVFGPAVVRPLRRAASHRATPLKPRHAGSASAPTDRADLSQSLRTSSFLGEREHSMTRSVGTPSRGEIEAPDADTPLSSTPRRRHMTRRTASTEPPEWPTSPRERSLENSLLRLQVACDGLRDEVEQADRRRSERLVRGQSHPPADASLLAHGPPMPADVLNSTPLPGRHTSAGLPPAAAASPVEDVAAPISTSDLIPVVTDREARHVQPILDRADAALRRSRRALGDSGRSEAE
ncbi:uncharacterized protein MONBRDRAFT_10999 [Monosiga brevicollis MX1]|uniref:Uncharacterized protein n=1 Tax=Monosiga brevicollis TaxID=81824 RepID=A9V7W9_MONBE|nr:uncharacterized protein MONBRDRAFT_10999 [Monosiga brevicollis MX1]EDQ86377.1 predicted protein [Monosiga brevicollis MX1]|eukprot:XP_001748767.1 hypothetical protein [Monosiga brevicollis MX1]